MPYRTIAEYSANCRVVESDSDGERMFVTATERFPEHIWVQAYAASPAFIYCEENQSAVYVHSAEFQEDRETVDNEVVVPHWAWFHVGGWPEEVSLLYTDHQFQDSERFVHLHTHSEYSALDGLGRVGEMLDAAQADGQIALALTDHGNCASHPELQAEADKRKMQPIFGMEAYFQDDRRQHDTSTLHGYWHLTLWAMDDEGLRNLWAMSTEGFADGLYGGKPRIDWDTLERFNGGVLASTGCLRGPVSHELAYDEEKGRTPSPEAAETNLGRLHRIFGDRLYIEMHTNQLVMQREVNVRLVEMAQRHGIPMIAAVDAHYVNCDDQHTHDVWLRTATAADIGDELGMFGGGQRYHLHTEAEVREALAYLGPEVADESIRNTARLAARCSARIESKANRPVYSRAAYHEDPVAADVDRLISICEQNWDRRTKKSGVDQAEYMERFEYEMELLIDKQFCGYFLMEWDLVSHAKKNRILVGPGRGSGGGSLVAYLMGITEIDPVRHGLLFARFMTKGREELPDFDIDFPSDMKGFMTNYVRERWGSDHVAVVGTHLRLKNKGVIDNLGRVFKSTLPPEAFAELKAFNKLVDLAEADTAGLGKSWEDLWAQHEAELEPFRAKYPELFDLAGKLVGRLKTYAKHAAGLIIDPDVPLTGALPLRQADDGQMVTQFDFPALELLGYVKFDLLNLRTLDTIQRTVDLIYERSGVWIDVYEWEEEYTDPAVFDEICRGYTLGHFQTETNQGTMMMKRLKPCNLNELADGTTLVRPGPMNSGLTDSFLRRRNGEQAVSYPDPRLESVLDKTFGCIVYQEDVMQTTMVLAGYDDLAADHVRKVLGKKKVEQAKVEGEKFIAESIKLGADLGAMNKLWAQMAEFAKYSFNRAHAFAYAILCYWTAWLKYHYPLEFLCATLSTVDADRIPEFVEESRRLGFQVLPPDINISKKGFVCTDTTIRYGLDSIKGIGDAAVDPLIEAQPFKSWDDFLDRQPKKCNIGHVKALVRIGAFDSLVPNRWGLEALIAEREIDQEKPVLRCAFRNSEKIGAPNALPCEYDWDHEPKALGRSGKPLKTQKAPPKKCTKGCRQFSPLPLPDPAVLQSYTEADIRNIEMDILGVYLSSTPFDRIPAEEKESLATAVDVMAGENGAYMLAAIVRGGIRLKEKNGNRFGFVSLYTEQGTVDAIVFDKYLKQYEEALKRTGMKLVSIIKNDRGQQLSHLIELE